MSQSDVTQDPCVPAFLRPTSAVYGSVWFMVVADLVVLAQGKASNPWRRGLIVVPQTGTLIHITPSPLPIWSPALAPAHLNQLCLWYIMTLLGVHILNKHWKTRYFCFGVSGLYLNCIFFAVLLAAAMVWIQLFPLRAKFFYPPYWIICISILYNAVRYNFGHIWSIFCQI